MSFAILKNRTGNWKGQRRGEEETWPRHAYEKFGKRKNVRKMEFMFPYGIAHQT